MHGNNSPMVARRKPSVSRRKGSAPSQRTKLLTGACLGFGLFALVLAGYAERAPDPGNPSAPLSRSPMAQEIQSLLDQEASALLALNEEFAAAADHAEALAVERELERVKQETEINILRIQKRHFLAEGRTEQAREIDEAIDDLLHPRVPPAGTETGLEQSRSELSDRDGGVTGHER